MSGCEAFRFPDAGKGPFSAAKDTLLRAKARNTLNARMLCASWFNVSANQPGPTLARAQPTMPRRAGGDVSQL